MVANDGASEAGREVVHSERRSAAADCVREPVVRREDFMAKIVSERSVKFVGAGPAPNGHLRTGHPAQPGICGGRQYPYFLHRLHRDQAVHTSNRAQAGKRASGGLRGRAAAADACVRAGAIHSEVMRVGTLSVGGELAGFSACGRRHDSTRHDFEKIQQPAPMDRKTIHLIAADCGADGGVLAVEERSCSYYRYHFMDAADDKREIRAHGLGGIELHAKADAGAKPLFANHDLVDSRLQGGDRVSAIGLRLGDAAEAEVFIDHADGGVRDTAA